MHGRSGENKTTAALLLDNVVKTYGPIRAVDGVSLEAQKLPRILRERSDVGDAIADIAWISR